MRPAERRLRRALTGGGVFDRLKGGIWERPNIGATNADDEEQARK